MEILLILLVTVLIVVFIQRVFFGPHEARNIEPAQPALAPPNETCENCSCQEDDSCQAEHIGNHIKLKILYGTQTGTSKKWAQLFATEASKRKFSIQVHDLATFDPDELNDKESIVVFFIATYADGTPPENCKAFYNWLLDVYNDFRVSRDHYKNMKYAVFGLGDSVYGKRFLYIAKDIDKMLSQLSATRLMPVGVGDTGAGPEVHIEDSFASWSRELFQAIAAPATKKIKTSDEPDEESEDEEADQEPLVDVEDLGKVMKKSLVKKSKAQEEEESSEDEEEVDPSAPAKEMLTPSLRSALTKQGYKLLGSHSGVKLCRWTKAMLRGRGGCYKHTFYGISSFQCMEMTPSLACANKCVFCWRHHKNPVGRDWRWQVDAPEFLVEQAVKNHQQMVKQLKGVPGVVKERFEEASTIRHCALSLVGEPIIYPYINKFVDLLHEKKISSFLVTNAQFPDKIDSMKPVTQLYISVDAATKDSLKKIDRPIFTDFWERFLGSIDSLAKKGQRTVFRLTLIKEWNMEEIKNYAELAERGRPSFIEIKGVTYCGTSQASTLTIKNVPFHEEVLRFSKEMIAANKFLSENYEVACEHEHSCCVLIADKRFKVNGEWHTWIDYTKFHELAQAGNPFNAFDYMAKTPSWAVTGSEEKGFDPEEIRFRRNKPYQGSGC